MLLIESVFFPEIRPIVDGMLTLETGEIMGRLFSRGIVGQNEVIAISGFIGKVETTAVTQKMIDHFSPNIVVLVSGAGALDPNLKPGDIVAGTEFQEYDLIVPTKSNSTRITSVDSNTIEHVQNFFQEAKLGKIISGDRLVQNSEERDELFRNTSALCLDMDSAAVARVSQMNKLPFAVFKVILDMCDENSERDFSVNFNRFSAKPAEIILSILKEHVLDIK
ncbi:MAG: 5'-methylthioadenosine/S-adenosylhomocysteine nucleosidase [Kosmotoga sp.]|uniref:5'-methylthioadenosine/S-adenosylhomocysteine nucleosidase n=1 Tax=Kosmotoga sp. TaxID=1955248 RepID=UPI0025C42B13|nr:5'-methylthioadenosine/S-adenosylhomocysteine nucleosidase [Kosmotoga sp.]MCD6160029.1 5'-methylthioadenosine/S-adenosylhomocysteine nucleosidase [Kosmotoga sp.]